MKCASLMKKGIHHEKQIPFNNSNRIHFYVYQLQRQHRQRNHRKKRDDEPKIETVMSVTTDHVREDVPSEHKYKGSP